jgi:tRNA A-37 threonylcarbamoyl transferase component Bud32
MNEPSPDPFHGLNPAELMAAAAMPTDGGADTIPLSPRDLPSLEEIATAFPDLEILDLIGHGGMSAVFRVRQPKLDRVVALKVLPKSLAATPGFAERFNREGRVLARLSHPSIVAVHDFGESGGFAYLIMEFVDGVNLRQAMRAGRFTPEQALKIIPAICEALQFAHTQGVLHRDIKPENILLDSTGKVKIADFGIAKILDEKGGDMLLTQSGARLGTAPYMAPEQIEQPSSVDHRADIYSLGVVFYEMLTGELPLGRFAAPSERSTCNGNVDEVVFRALEKERGRRQQSASEFKTQIEGLASMPPFVQRALTRRFQSFEYKSRRMIFGRPLLHVTSGIDPATGRRRVARGFFAFGDIAIGVFAFGGYARGLVACGGMAIGCLSFGGLSLGLISVGGLALALLFALGGGSVGLVSSGGLAVGWWAAGGMAAGVHAFGGAAYALVSGMGGKVHAPQVIKSLTEMPAMLQWLEWLTINSPALMGWLWLPAVLPSSLLPWWARKQLEFEACGGHERATVWHERPSRVFWIVPATLMASLEFVLLTFRWTHAGDLTLQNVIATGIEIIGFLLLALSLPLWLRLVPANPIYGVRLPSTTASEKRWYDVNAYFGKQLFIWSLAVVGAGIAGFYQLPRHQDAYPWAALTLTLVSVAASVISTLWWMHQHPADKPAPSRNRLASWFGQGVVAVVIALFIKSFIFGPYRIPQGNEPGVAKNSHWIASHLDTGFSTGDLIIFEHESGNYWIARVVAREPKGLRLKRGGSPDEFFMPWDKIVGKMLFSHFSPDALKQAGGPDTELTKKTLSNAETKPARPVPSMPVTEGSERAPNAKAELSFMRIAMNDKPWPDSLYDITGKRVPMTPQISEAVAAMSSRHTSRNANDCYLQVWVNHPDFEPSSELSVHLLDANLEPLKGSGTISRNISNQAGLHGYLSIVVGAGDRKDLPPRCAIKVRCSFGRWDVTTRVNPNNHTSISAGDWILGSIGESAGEGTFVSWGKQNLNRQMQCLAHLKDGTVLVGSAGLTSSGGLALERARFDVKLAEIDHFMIRSRDCREVIFKNVVIPPLP